jgi:Holliday junction resolvase
MSKKRGIAAERELLHMLWDKGFACCRVAGSGCIPEPSCDLLAGNCKDKYAIECKTSRKKKKYLERAQIQEFKLFAEKFGLKAMLAVRFIHNGWWFIEPEKLDETGKGLAISLEDIQKRGQSFEGITGNNI